MCLATDGKKSVFLGRFILFTHRHERTIPCSTPRQLYIYGVLLGLRHDPHSQRWNCLLLYRRCIDLHRLVNDWARYQFDTFWQSISHCRRYEDGVMYPCSYPGLLTAEAGSYLVLYVGSKLQINGVFTVNGDIIITSDDAAAYRLLTYPMITFASAKYVIYMIYTTEY